MSNPVPVGLLADPRDVRSLWRETTRNLETACGWQFMTPKPDEIADLTPSAIEKLRTNDDVNNRHALTVWNEWALARSFQIAANIDRMRALLCLLRYWRRVQRADPDDIEAAQGVLTVWEFAKTQWGIEQPPTDSKLWPAYCEHHVMAMARRKERCR